jgi:hypothetical protein
LRNSNNSVAERRRAEKDSVKPIGLKTPLPPRGNLVNVRGLEPLTSSLRMTN